MGATPDRIAAEDFVTPAELRGLKLAAAAAGRIGGVRLELAGTPAGTALSSCYQQVPLRILPPFALPADRAALVYLLNPTAGLLDGDGQMIQVTARPGSRAVLTGQSATRIHPCLKGFATQQWHIQVEAGAVLVVLPGPAIPFAGCRYYQRVAIELAPEAGLAWGDIWLAGRYARGRESELFRFERVIQELTVRRAGALVYRDRFCWEGPWQEEAVKWHFGTAAACASLFITGGLPDALAEDDSVPEKCHFPTAAGDHVLRWRGEPERVIAALVRTALAAGSMLAGDNKLEPWLLSGHDLAPNHWFSSGAHGGGSANPRD
jgi:urease accessory protein